MKTPDTSGWPEPHAQLANKILTANRRANAYTLITPALSLLAFLHTTTNSSIPTQAVAWGAALLSYTLFSLNHGAMQAGIARFREAHFNGPQ